MFFPSLYTTPDHISEGREGHCQAGVVLHSHFLPSQAEEWTTMTVEWRHQQYRQGSARTIIPRCCDAHCTAIRLYGHLLEVQVIQAILALRIIWLHLDRCIILITLSIYYTCTLRPLEENSGNGKPSSFQSSLTFILPVLSFRSKNVFLRDTGLDACICRYHCQIYFPKFLFKFLRAYPHRSILVDVHRQSTRLWCAHSFSRTFTSKC